MKFFYFGIGVICGICKDSIVNFFEKSPYDKYSPLFRQIILEADHYKTVNFDENNKIMPALYMSSAESSPQFRPQFRPHIYRTYGPAFRSIISKEEFDKYLHDPSRKY